MKKLTNVTCWCALIMCVLGVLTPIEVIMMIALPLPKNIMGFLLDVDLAAMFVTSLVTWIYAVLVIRKGERETKDPLDIIKEDFNY